LASNAGSPPDAIRADKARHRIRSRVHRWAGPWLFRGLTTSSNRPRCVNRGAQHEQHRLRDRPAGRGTDLRFRPRQRYDFRPAALRSSLQRRRTRCCLGRPQAAATTTAQPLPSNASSALRRARLPISRGSWPVGAMSTSRPLYHTCDTDGSYGSISASLVFAALTARSNPALSFCASGATAPITNTSPIRS
jgi:hypothetical protein